MPSSKQIESMILSELVAYSGERLQHSAGGGIEERLRNAIAVRIAELQDTGAQALVKATGQLGRTTARLVCATWGLVGATVLLVFAEIVLKLWGR